MKDRKTMKSRSEEKVVGFSSTSLFPAWKWEAVTRVELTGDRPPMTRITHRTSIIIGWDHEHIPDAFTYEREIIVDLLAPPPTNEPKLPQTQTKFECEVGCR